MRKYCAILYLLLSMPVLLAAQRTLTGKVVEEKSGEPVFAANVYIAGKLSTGVTTGMEGAFSLTLQESELSEDTLVVSFIGYQKQRLPLSSFKTEQSLRIRLKAEREMLQEVVVKAKDPIAEDFSVETLEKLDVYYNPFSNGDPLKAITATPASTNTDESANPALRGSSPQRSVVALNEVPIYRPVRNSQINGIGNFSLFNTEIIDKQYVYPSNPPLNFGNTSAGLVEIQTIDKLSENNLQLSAGLANVGFFLSQRLQGDQSFFQLYGNRQFSGAFLGVNQGSFDFLKGFQNVDMGLNAHHQINDHMTANLFSYGIKESYQVQQQMYTYEGQADAVNRRNFNVFNLDYTKGKWHLSLNNGTNFSNTTYDFGNIQSERDNRQAYTSINAKYFPVDQLSLQSGINHDYGYYRFDDIFPRFFYAVGPDAPTTLEQVSVDNHLLEYYLYGKWKSDNDLSVSGGLRKNLPVGDQTSYWSYQASLRYPFDERNAVQLSAGQYHNYRRPNFLAKSFALLRSRQAALDFQHETENRRLQFAAFLKQESGERNSDVFTSNQINTFGLEISYQQVLFDYFSFMLSNTFLDRELQIGEESYRANNSLDYFLKASVSFNHPRWFNLSLAYIDRPGTFFTRIQGGRFNAAADAFEPVFSDAINGAQLGAYRNLSLNFNRYFRLGQTAVIGFLTLNNLFNRRNPSGPLYNEDYSQISYQRFQMRTFYAGLVWQLYY